MRHEVDRQSAKAPWPRGARTLLVVALLAGIYFAYGPALDGELQFDDVTGIANNPPVRDLARFERSGFAYLVGAGRWLVDLTFSINYRLSGLAVRPYHLVNLGAHLAVTLALLAFGIFLLRRAKWPAPFLTAGLAAALFGLHPLASQAVAYISQRAEVLAALCALLALRLAIEAEERRGVGFGASLAGAVFFCFAGWGVKPTLATLPASLLLCNLAFPTRSRTKEALVSLPFWVMTLLFSRRLLTVVHGSAHAGFDIPSLGPGRYFLTQARVVLTYLRLLVWPSGQNVDWDFRPSLSAVEPRTALALAAVALLLLAALWLWRWSSRAEAGELRTLARLSAFGILWFFVQLAPTSSVVPVADVLAEHRPYLASWGIFLPAAAALVFAVRRFAPDARGAAAGSAVAVMVCLACGVALHRRARVWETSVALWSDAAAKSPLKPRVHMNLGYALVATDPARAIDEFQLALRLADGTVRRDELQQNLAGALLSMHRYDEAIAILKDLVATAQPMPQLQTNLAIAELESGRRTDAAADAQQVVARWPSYAPAHDTLGRLALLRQDYAAARRHFDTAVALDPDSATSLAALAAAEERMGDTAAACATWSRTASTAGADAPEAHAALAALAALGCNLRH